MWRKAHKFGLQVGYVQVRALYLFRPLDWTLGGGGVGGGANFLQQNNWETLKGAPSEHLHEDDFIMPLWQPGAKSFEDNQPVVFAPGGARFEIPPRFPSGDGELQILLLPPQSLEARGFAEITSCSLSAGFAQSFARIRLPHATCQPEAPRIRSELFFATARKVWDLNRWFLRKPRKSPNHQSKPPGGRLTIAVLLGLTCFNDLAESTVAPEGTPELPTATLLRARLESSKTFPNLSLMRFFLVFLGCPQFRGRGEGAGSKNEDASGSSKRLLLDPFLLDICSTPCQKWAKWAQRPSPEPWLRVGSPGSLAEPGLRAEGAFRCAARSAAGAGRPREERASPGLPIVAGTFERQIGGGNWGGNLIFKEVSTMVTLLCAPGSISV